MVESKAVKARGAFKVEKEKAVKATRAIKVLKKAVKARGAIKVENMKAVKA